MPDKPSTGRSNTFGVHPTGRSHDVFIGMDRNIDVMERPGKVARNGGPIGEVRVQNGGDISTAAAPILRLSRTGLPTSVLPVIWIRLTATEKRRVWILAMDPHRVIK
ncbi:hypothetical protein ACFY3B_03500 [Micromonospora parva]|uniref:Uncharacterized protein n=1 Tax=Micromonospora parva TaxID=1464048 RepID=A0ABW6VLZ2_9ACTN